MATSLHLAGGGGDIWFGSEGAEPSSVLQSNALDVGTADEVAVEGSGATSEGLAQTAESAGNLSWIFWAVIVVAVVTWWFLREKEPQESRAVSTATVNAPMKTSAPVKPVAETKTAPPAPKVAESKPIVETGAPPSVKPAAPKPPEVPGNTKKLF